MTSRCHSCECELTIATRQHANSGLCRECFPNVRRCTMCKTVKPLASFYGGKSFQCRECSKLKARPGLKTCKTCGTTRPAIEYRLNAKDCPDCFGKQRRCAECKHVRPLEDFHYTASGQGMRRVCKHCVNKAANDKYHQRLRQCRICQKEGTSFPLNFQICTDCYGKFRKCPDCEKVKEVSKFRPSQPYCLDCANRKDHERRLNQTRRCLECGEQKLPSEFTKHKRVCSQCKDKTAQVCGCCGVLQPLSEFSERNPKTATGLATRCKGCSRDRARRWMVTARGRYSTTKQAAKRSGCPLEVPFDKFAELIQQPCHYCGHELNETGSGLDRINPLLGYTLDNVVPCCRSCNWTKSDYFTYDEMLVIGEAMRRVKDKRLGHRSNKTKLSVVR